MLSRRLAATLILLTLTAGTSLSFSAPAVALERCGDRQPIVDVLAKKYDEHRRAIGIMGQAGLVEFYVSKSGTWTVIVSSPSGRTCIVAAGHSWDDIPAEKNLTGI
jgi:hypothetical protein